MEDVYQDANDIVIETSGDGRPVSLLRDSLGRLGNHAQSLRLSHPDEDGQVVEAELIDRFT